MNTPIINGSGGILGKGTNGSGQLGNGDTISYDAYQPLDDNLYYLVTAYSGNCYNVHAQPAPTEWKYIATGFNTTLAVDKAGDLYGWGNNMNNIISRTMGSFYQIPCPKKATYEMHGFDFETLSLGTTHVAAKTTSGEVYTWGEHLGYVLGRTNPENYVASVGIIDAVQVEAGIKFTMVLKSDGSIVVWGIDQFGQLGDGEGDSTDVAHRNPAFPLKDVNGTLDDTSDDVARKFISIAAGAHFALALEDNGTVWGWGLNSYGQIGNVIGENAFVPREILDGEGNPLTNVSEIFAGSFHGIALKGNTILGWGDNYYGQLGSTPHTGNPLPTEINLP